MGFGQVGRRLEQFDVRANGQTIRASFALASRVRNYGGDLEIAHHTSLFDDSFEVVLFEGRSSWRYLKYLAGVAFRRVSGLKGVSVIRACQVSAACGDDQRIEVQVDGEFAGRLPASLEIVPDALTLLIPPAYYRKHRRG